MVLKRPTEAEIQAEFKRRRGVVDLDPDVILMGFKRARRTGVTVLLLMLGLSAGIWALIGVGWLDIFWGGLLFGGTWIAGILALGRYYVCPQCGELPLTAWEWDGLSAHQDLDLSPSSCRKCGARLR